MNLLQDIHGILELAKLAKRDAEASQKSRKEITVRLLPNAHSRLADKIDLVLKNLEEEMELTTDIKRKEKKRRE